MLFLESLMDSRTVCLFLTGAVFVGLGSARNQEPTKMLRHVVMVKFKEANTPDETKQVVEAFQQLPKKIPLVSDFEFGTDVSPEKLADGFTHCFLMSFKSDKDRDAYLVHPAHREFVEIALPRIDKVLVVDFWNGK